MAFTNIGSEEDLFSAITSTTYTASVAVPDLAANSIGFVAVASVAGSGGDITGVTWNGDAMTEGPATVDSAGRIAEIWYRANPDDNGTYNIIVTFGDSVVRSVSVVTGWADASAAVSLDDTSVGSGDTQNPTITSTQAGANELVVSVSAHAANALGSPTTTNCTELQSWDSGANCTITAYSIPSSSGDVTHQHNYSQAETYAIVSASFKEAAGAGRTTKNTDAQPLGINAGISRRVN